MDELSKELLRKVIHFLGVFYFLLYAYYGKLQTLEVVSALTLLSLSIEILRRRFRIIPYWILDPYEIRGIGAHLYFGISTLLLTVFLSPEAAVVGVVVGSVGDGVAGLIKTYQRREVKKKGRKTTPSTFRGCRGIGSRNRVRDVKSTPLVGMFLVSFLTLLLISNLRFGDFKFEFDLRVVVLACLVGAVIENKPIKIREFYINDNFSVPLFAGIFYHLLS